LDTEPVLTKSRFVVVSDTPQAKQKQQQEKQ